MEPWFTKEAEIIKFPEPKQKVIRMPNVASYPDFLTGVKDLQNRLSDGQISKESYDKLYQDLLHRFMKKESFEASMSAFRAQKEEHKLSSLPLKMNSFVAPPI